MKSGFTLIELSIVLVIIGLIIGGILTGQDLINSATIRAQISQMEKYNTAVNTFRGKYGYLPGDIPNPYATQFGFEVRGTNPGQGDGNGVLQGNCTNSATLTSQNGFHECCNGLLNCTTSVVAETTAIWMDLSTASLLDATITGNWSTTFTNIWPLAKIGQQNFVYAYSANGINYFGISTITAYGNTFSSSINPGLTVQQAYAIDSKTDDGLPQSGNVTACYVNNNIGGYTGVWAAGNQNDGAYGGGGWWAGSCLPTTAATPYQTYNCYDNAATNPNGVAGVEKYSLQQNAGVNNCALSFRFQ